MSEPIRYLDREGSDFARTLLKSAHVDRPSDRSVQRALRTAALAAATTTATGTGAAAATAAASSTALWLKWLGIGLLTGGIGAFGATAWFGSESEKPVSRTPPAPVTAAEPTRAEPARPEPTLVPTPEPLAGSETPPETARPRAERGSSTPSAVPAPSAPQAGDSLARELAYVDAARRRLSSGDARGAIAELDRYQRDFPKPRFGEEAALVRADSLASLGNCAAAIRIADSMGGGSGKSVLDRRWKALRERCR